MLIMAVHVSKKIELTFSSVLKRRLEVNPGRHISWEQHHYQGIDLFLLGTKADISLSLYRLSFILQEDGQTVLAFLLRNFSEDHQTAIYSIKIVNDFCNVNFYAYYRAYFNLYTK